MTRGKVPEVLAPAGDMERLEAALRYGADAVYLGMDRFTMRSAPKNFTPEQLEAARKIKAFFDPEGLLNPGNML